MRTPPRGQRVAPYRRVAVRIGFDLHVYIVQAIPEAGHPPRCRPGEQRSNGKYGEAPQTLGLRGSSVVSYVLLPRNSCNRASSSSPPAISCVKVFECDAGYV